MRKLRHREVNKLTTLVELITGRAWVQTHTANPRTCARPTTAHFRPSLALPFHRTPSPHATSRPSLLFGLLYWWLLFLWTVVCHIAFSCEPLEGKDHVLFIFIFPLPTVLGTWRVPNTYLLNKNKRAGECLLLQRILFFCLKYALPLPTTVYMVGS